MQPLADQVQSNFQRWVILGLPTWLSQDEIRAEIESKYPNLKLAQAPGWLFHAAIMGPITE
jgi:hypothetical protein